MRWHYRDAALLWLFPPAYLAHLAEEFWADPGLPAWFAVIFGRPLPIAAFVGINVVAFSLMIAGIRLAIRREESGWAAVAVATALALNGLLHLAGSVMTASYSPGLITGVVLYLPLGQLLLVRAAHQVEFTRFTRGVLAGIGVHTAVTVVAAALARGG